MSVLLVLASGISFSRYLEINLLRTDVPKFFTKLFNHGREIFANFLTETDKYLRPQALLLELTICKHSF